MWILNVREAAPDAPYWSGRRALAAVDALVWPALWLWVIVHLPQPVGLVGPVAEVAVIGCAAARLHRAVWVNHRYRFTTWRWCRWVCCLWLLGVGLKLAMHP